MTETIVRPEVVESLARARAAAESAAVAAKAATPAIPASQRRTLERLRDRLRDEERDGFLSCTGSHIARADYARQVREEIAALDVAIAALSPKAAG